MSTPTPLKMMKRLYDNLFATIFVIAKTRYDASGGAVLSDTRGFSVLWLTSLLLMNISTVVLYLEIPVTTTTYALDALITAIVLYVCNAYLYLYKTKYKKVVEDFGKLKPEINALWVVVSIGYQILTWYFFLTIHSQTFSTS